MVDRTAEQAMHDMFAANRKAMAEVAKRSYYTIIIWLHGRTARTIVRDQNGNVINMSDGWNNISSSLLDAMANYPMAEVRVCRDAAERQTLNQEWDKNIK